MFVIETYRVMEGKADETLPLTIYVELLHGLTESKKRAAKEKKSGIEQRQNLRIHIFSLTSEG